MVPDNAVEVASLVCKCMAGWALSKRQARHNYRDARILPIYEGTNGIQAADLVFRKVQRDGGVAFAQWVKSMKEDETVLPPMWLRLCRDLKNVGSMWLD